MTPDFSHKYLTWYHVDDDADDVLIYKDIISETIPQVKLHSFQSSFDLIRKLNDTSVIPRIILIDLNMPVVDGLGCLKHVKILPHVRDFTRLIILSTDSNPEMIDICRNAGAHFYAVKPSDTEEIAKLVQDIFEISKNEYIWPVSKARFLLTPATG